MTHQPRQLFMIWFCTVLLLVIGVIALVADIGRATVASSSETASGDACLKCHQNIWDKAMAMSYIHKPFLEKKCVLCHIQDDQLVNEFREFMQDSNVQWLASRRVSMKAHWYVVPIAEINDHLLIDYQVSGVGTNREVIVLPPLDELTELVDDKTPPLIDQVKVTDVSRGLFLTATIKWDTDELANSELIYGMKKPTIMAGDSHSYTKHHRVQLTDLKFKKEYRCVIVSEDIFGNRSETKPFSFDTDHAKPKLHMNPGGNTDAVEEHTTKYKLYRLADSIAIRFVANTSVITALGTPKKSEKKGKDLAAKGLKPENHNLKDALTTNNTVCEPCHGRYVKDRNHPVNVPAKPGMEIPADYFVLSNPKTAQ